MRLKEYQSRALETLSAYLKALSEAETTVERTQKAIAALPGDLRASVPPPPSATNVAWNEVRKNGIAAYPDPWRALIDGAGRSIPHVCLKLPTGGGKTLLAAHCVDRILVNHFHQSTGLVLWIVPSEAIYSQTRAQLADRGHPLRQALDRASGGRVKLLEKLDAFTKQDVGQSLCILLMMLQAAGRENKETLKVFRDSGRYPSFFPKEDDSPALKDLLKAIPNLDQYDLGDSNGVPGSGLKQSLGNTMRVVRPVMVLDEGHRAYTDTARQTLAGLNPRFLLELSATPDRELSNILVNVSGSALKDEEMIKLPIRLEVGRKLHWQTILQNAKDHLDNLERLSRSFQDASGRYIRPIMLVRVDRTGKDQRDKGGELVHSEDVFEFLTQRAGVPAEAIRRQTAELKELKDDDLLSPYCPVRIIITKDALREGWDCPFAYVLTILSKGTAETALTQMVGRVLRQPHAARTGVEPLDESHVFCADVDVADALSRIKSGLEAEGMGDLAGEVKLGKEGTELTEIKVRFRKAFRGQRIMVPRVLHRDGGKTYRDIDYEADVLASVDFGKLAWQGADSFPLKNYDIGRRDIVDIDILPGAEFGLESHKAETVSVPDQVLDRPGLIRRLIEVVPNPWQGARILDEALAKLAERATESDIIAARLMLVETIKRDIQKQVEAEAEQVFRTKVKTGEIVFKLVATPPNLNYEFQELLKIHVASADEKAPLLRSLGTPLERSLYETAFRKNVNGFEKDVALYLDGESAVTWWHRVVARRDWGLQGWMKHRVYPDFLIRLDTNKQTARLLVLETKGKHLEGSEDTEFKTKFFSLLEEAYTSGKAAGDIELFSQAPEAMRFRILLQQGAWEPDLEKALA